MKILSLLATSAFAGATSSCRCTSKDSCWPSQSQWESLNASISHNLIALRPYGSPCHAPSYDATLCNTITHNPNTNSVFRASMPAALQYPNWETLPSANQSCLVGTDKQIPCGQGRVSLYSALVKTPVQVQEAVRFAKKHNLRLAIRNTGHSYLGTSSAPESLQIFTHGLDNITVMESFIPHGAQRSRGSAVTIGAGVMLKDLYQALSQHGVIAVAGLSPSVGAAGGYVQGAGHSPLSPLLGLAADNVLQFTVVTAQGDLVLANDYQNTDLFWALRGGGGGTFGVVVDVTFQTYPDMPAYLQFYKMQTNNATAFWNSVTDFHSLIPRINDGGASGYYSIDAAASAAPPYTLGGFFIFANFTQDRAQDVQQILSPLVSSLQNEVGDGLIIPPANYSSSMHTFLQYYQQTSPDPTGFIDRIGSRLISKDLLNSHDGPSELTAALQKASTSSFSVLGHIVAGSKVSSNKNINAVNPAWRRAATHLAISWAWPLNATVGDQEQVTSAITHQWMPALRDLEPDMGAYVNEADADEPNWQMSFWGANYLRLRQIKRKWDPLDLFLVRRGVGSEDWDEEGLCKLRDCR